MSVAGRARDFVARFVSNLDDWKVDKAEDDLKHLERVADDAGKDVDQAFDRMGRSADAMAADISQATDKVKRELKQMSSAVRDEAGEIRESFGEAGKESGSEFASNLGESVASGDLSSIAQDTLGGLVSAFASLPAGLGVPLAGLAAITAKAFSDMQRQAEEAAARIGAAFESQLSKLNVNLEELANGAWVQEFLGNIGGKEGVAGGIEKIQELLQGSGVQASEFVAALTQGGQPAQDMADRIRVIAQTSRDTNGSWENGINNMITLTEYIQDAKRETEKASGAAGTMAAAYQLASSSTAGLAANLDRVNQNTYKSWQNAIQLNGALSTAAESAELIYEKALGRSRA